MKKIVIATLFALVAVSASAVEVGVIGGEVFQSNKHTNNTAGVTVGEQFGKFGVTGEFDHNFKKTNQAQVNRYSIIGSYDVTKIGSATIGLKAGAGFVDTTNGRPTGYEGLVGAGVTVPVTAKISATADYRYAKAQDRIKDQSGNQVLIGVKYSF
jgi:outer membrane autotransporter protein